MLAITAAIFGLLLVDIVLDDHLHADPHMDDADADEERDEHRDERRAERCDDSRLAGPRQVDDDQHEGDGERHQRHAGDALAARNRACPTGPSHSRGPGRAGSSSRSSSRLPSVDAAKDPVADDPQEQRQRDRADEGGRGEPVALRLAVSIAEVPDEMPDARRACGASAPRYSRKGRGGRWAMPSTHCTVARACEPRRGRHQPPGEQQRCRHRARRR